MVPVDSTLRPRHSRALVQSQRPVAPHAAVAGPSIGLVPQPARFRPRCNSRPMRYLGVDLAWGEGSLAKPANRSGVVALEPDGRIGAAGWTIGLDETVDWIE